MEKDKLIRDYTNLAIQYFGIPNGVGWTPECEIERKKLAKEMQEIRQELEMDDPPDRKHKMVELAFADVAKYLNTPIWDTKEGTWRVLIGSQTLPNVHKVHFSDCTHWEDWEDGRFIADSQYTPKGDI